VRSVKRGGSILIRQLELAAHRRIEVPWWSERTVVDGRLLCLDAAVIGSEVVGFETVDGCECKHE